MNLLLQVLIMEVKMMAYRFFYTFFLLIIGMTVASLSVRSDILSGKQQQIRISSTEQKSSILIAQNEITSKSADVIKIAPEKMGLSPKVLPGAQFLSSKEWKAMKTIPKTGLFIIDSQAIPRELPKLLEKEGYKLEQNGTLRDSKGKPVAMFLQPAYFKITKQKKAHLTPRHPNSNQFSKTLGEYFIPNAQAGNPHNFRCFSAWPWAVYRNGFCRNYEAKTFAHSYGLDEHRACSRNSPHTRIQYIETRASIGGRRDRDDCRNCDNEQSRVKWDIGCFWPAHGGASGAHYAHLTDEGISVTRSWSW